MTARIVLTGAPASGKTIVFEKLKNDPDLVDFVFLEELARKLLIENPSYRQNWPAFHLEIYRRQVAQEQIAGNRPFITDRGTVDAFAFHPETVHDVHTTLKQEFARYTAVLHLGTAAALGEEYYVRDDIRNESISDALAIEKAIEHVWKEHHGYHFLAADPDFNLKVERAVALVKFLAFQH
jgi:predicted ATPase